MGALVLGDRLHTRVDLDRLLAGLQARRSGSGWSARCPVHEDRNPSFSINYYDGCILVHCHAGCPQKTVLAELRRRVALGDSKAGLAREFGISRDTLYRYVPVKKRRAGKVAK